jgi:hypothetical protein
MDKLLNMDTLLNNISKLPKELQIMIDEYNVEHRKKFNWSLEELKRPCYCDTCNKYIKTNVYSLRNGDENCCSPECLDNIGWVSVDQYGDKWIFNGEEYVAVTSPSDYEYTNY